MKQLFEIPQDEIIRLAAFGRTRTGKTTFAATNVPGPIYAIDSDKGFLRTRRNVCRRYKELNCELFTPEDIKGYLQPLYIDQQFKKIAAKQFIASTVIDSVTKIYEFNTAPAVMAGRLTAQERDQLGFSKNKASNLQDKAYAIRVLTYIASYGTHVFYIWHERESIDVQKLQSGTVEKIMVESMSKEERQRLLTSVDMVVRFEHLKGRYAATVLPETRGFGEEPNTDFTIYDHSNNYWHGGLARLYGLTYTVFYSKEEAVNWGLQALGKEDYIEGEAYFDRICQRNRIGPDNLNQAWVPWMLAIEEKFLAKQKKKPVEVKEEKKDKREPSPEKEDYAEQHLETHIEKAGLETQPFDAPSEYDMPEDMEVGVDPAAPEGDETVSVTVDANGDPLTYGNGDLVREDQIDDCKEYQERFKKTPYDAQTLERAKSMAEDWPQ